jgi:very-short-patch-repair endonuclease
MPVPRSNPRTMYTAGRLRREATPDEQRLWAYLRGDRLGVSFRRQHALGSYVADFCSIKKKLVIELDGSQHLEQDEYDQERTRCLQAMGYRVLRFWNVDVMNDIEGVIRAIAMALADE